MITSFSKYEALGNDFIIIDDRSDAFLTSKELIQHLCHRNFGIGADGIVLLKKSKSDDFKMAIYNSNGKEATMCGNALCCLIKFIKDLGYKSKSFQIETKAYHVQGGYIDNKIYFIAPLPKVLKKDYKIKYDDNYISIDLIDSGVNHAICYVDDLLKTDVEKDGKYLREHENFHPSGANINFVQLDKKNKASLRVFEKGVEKETFACTTGAIATAYSIKEKNNITSSIDINFKRGKVEVFFDNNQTKIINSANHCFAGEINLKNFIQS